MALEQVGRVVGGKWRLDRLLGTGGMAAVYRAESPSGERAAVKVLHPEMSRRADVRHRFMQEGTAATRVGHPGAVQVLGYGEESDGTAFLVLELLEGEPLSTVVRRPGGLPIERLLAVLDEVLDVLAAAHAKGIVHRDLKPDNLFVTTDGHIKVLDFGIARVLDDVPGAYKTRTGMTLGTMPYMSPEQALGKRGQIDGRADLFSLGAMTFRIVTGRNVHQANSDTEMLVAMASKPAPPLASVAPHADAGLCAVVDVALAFSKDSRYPDASTMQGDVRALLCGNAPSYAMRIRQARDTATRADLPVPPIAFGAGAPTPRSGSPISSATPIESHDAPTIAEAPLTASPPSSFQGAAVSRVPAHAHSTRIDAPPDTPPPSSLRAMVMPVVDPSDLAPTVQMSARDFPNEVRPQVAERTMASPGTSSGKTNGRIVLWVALGVGVLFAIGLAVYLLSSSDTVPASREAQSRSDSVTPQDPTTQVATVAEPAPKPPEQAGTALSTATPSPVPAGTSRAQGKTKHH